LFGRAGDFGAILRRPIGVKLESFAGFRPTMLSILPERTMTLIVSRIGRFSAAVLVLGFVAEVRAGSPWSVRPQRRGGRFVMPSKPPSVDSSPMIDDLNKALKALGETNRPYDGHREKACVHIGAAIRHLEQPGARGKNGAAVEKAVLGKPAVATGTATTPEAASDESLRKAKKALFVVHHKLTTRTDSRGQIRADAEVRIAISEISAALRPIDSAPKTESTAK
jgi:hypothetical protein